VNDTYEAPAGSGGGLKTAILFGIVLALIGANIYLYMQLERTRSDVAKMKEAILTEISNLRETSSVTTQTARRHLDTLRDELETARRQAAMAAGQAKEAATKRAEELAQRLAAEQAKQAAQVKSELTEVKQATTAANTKIGEVSTEVGTVKTEIASTKSELENTINSLKRVVGDLDQHGSLIAANAKELAALRSLGDRNYFEFSLKKSKQPQKVGDVAIQLKKTDAKKNKYTIEVIADDKKVEKKDRNTNEPVQFYVSKARQPWEIVVNEVRKDEIVGYLSTPKVQASRN
jgi:chromosome segregation ATPase